MMVLSQLSRAPEPGKGPPPAAQRLRESGSIEQDATWSFIFRRGVPERPRDLRGLAELIVASSATARWHGDLVFLHAQTKFENRAEDAGPMPEE